MVWHSASDSSPLHGMIIFPANTSHVKSKFPILILSLNFWVLLLTNLYFYIFLFKMIKSPGVEKLCIMKCPLGLSKSYMSLPSTLESVWLVYIGQVLCLFLHIFSCFYGSFLSDEAFSANWLRWMATLHRWT